MRLMYRVIEMVRARGCFTTVDDLLPELAQDGYGRRQVIRALQNGHYRGYLCFERGRARAGRGQQDGTNPGLYLANPRREVVERVRPVPIPRAASVWDYAQKVSAECTA